MWNIFRRKGKPVPLEAQIETLAACGIRLASGRGAADLTASVDRTLLESNPYELLLTVMGSGDLSDDVWHFDTECIENHGDYAAIATRLRTLAKGALPLEAIEDYVEVEDGEAWLAFQLDGQPFRWDAAVDSDWVDTSILTRFADLLVRRKTGRRFTCIDLGGQSCLIGCATPDGRDTLRAKTGLAVDWLT